MTRALREKSPLASKKFLAWLLSEMTWKAIIVLALVIWKDDLTSVSTWAWWFMLSIVLTAGFVGIGFILGQAALDKYVRLAEIAADEVREKVERPSSEETETTDKKVNT